ncbi:MAG: Polyribonucleotide nucleotidyltransferase [Microgenomates group bacterium GW2011_GWC1_37_8]|nr:MAG: Polyribonucleotide nucleotidyltransferase [Microgenomates group bacterium GW2011_GWC1_37_8]
MKIEKSIELGGRILTLSTGHVAAQADGAVMASYGESRWVKREGRPTDEEILSARLIDRSIRPLFPKEYAGRDVQVIVTVLSVDMENRPDIVAAVATSAAIAISPIPWDGPMGVVRIGLKEKKYLTNPVETDIDLANMDLIVATNREAVIMIEAGAKQVSEEIIVKGIEAAQKESTKVIELIDELVSEVKPKKVKVEKSEISKDLYKKIKNDSLKQIQELVPAMAIMEAGYSAMDELKRAVLASLDDSEKAMGVKIFESLFQDEVRSLILSGKRPDGRKHDEIRPLSAQVGILPRTHGSAIFQRGQTQAMTIATLGAPSLEQLIETATGEESKRYIHHYSMPPFSIGETGRIGSPNRREIGHGALAERALIPVIPEENEFPYTIRVVTEILSSNGSTSMASVCGSTLSLMDAGVPIKAPIAGIAMGLVVENDKKYAVLTDIVGLEDGNGDMDFKVAGSKDGITAMQMDVKTLNLTLPVLEAALAQAKSARLEILKVIASAIDKPRDGVSKYAPKIKIIRIPPDKIGELIGPGGKTIKKIIAETGAQVDVDDDGTVFISGVTKESKFFRAKKDWFTYQT